MKPLLLASLCVVVLGAGAGLAWGQGRASASSSAPTVAPSGSAAALEAAPVPLSAVEIPSAKSELPTLEEWRGARPVAFTRRSSQALRCRGFLVREYLKVHCDNLVVGIRQTAGSTDGSALFVLKPSLESDSSVQGGQVIFPLRRGDARQFQFFDGAGGYQGLSATPHVVVDAHWPAGDDAPSVIVR